MNKKISISLAFIVIIIVVVLATVAYKHRSLSPDNVIKIGVSQISSVAVFDEIKNGIIKGFASKGYVDGKNIVFDFQNAQGDNSTNAAIAQKFANSDYDLFIPLGTPSSQALVNLVKDRPIVFGAVTDPVSAGLVKTIEEPGSNVTGVSDITLYKEQLALLKEIAPNVKTVSLLYNPSEVNTKYAIDQTKKFGEPMGFSFITTPVNNSGDVLSAARSVANKVDAFYMLPDNAVYSGQDALIKVAIESKKPLISIEQSGVEKGALATLGTNYEKLGEKAAEVALKILKGQDTATTPVFGVTDADLFVNTTTADKIGITLPKELIDQAKQVYN